MSGRAQYFGRPEFVGPPSPTDMEGIARALVQRDQLERAREVADAMVEHWHHVPGETATVRFYWWLGFVSAVASMQLGARRPLIVPDARPDSPRSF